MGNIRHLHGDKQGVISLANREAYCGLTGDIRHLHGDKPGVISFGSDAVVSLRATFVICTATNKV